MTRLRLAPFLALLALWPLWVWCGRAWAAPGAEYAECAALASFAALALARAKGGEWRPSAAWLAFAGSALVAFATLWTRAPRPVAGAFGLLGLGGATLSALPKAARDRSIGLLGLLLLALPMRDSLEFVAGYPLRRASGALAAAALRGCGIDSEAVGAGLRVGDALLFVDPACAGVHLSWVALLLAFLLGTVRGMRPFHLVVFAGLAQGLGLLANGGRIAALAWAEWRGSGAVSNAVHEAVGLCAFLAVALALAVVSRERGPACAA